MGIINFCIGPSEAKFYQNVIKIVRTDYLKNKGNIQIYQFYLLTEHKRQSNVKLIVGLQFINQFAQKLNNKIYNNTNKNISIRFCNK